MSSALQLSSDPVSPSLSTLAPIIPMRSTTFAEDVAANGSLAWCNHGTKIAVGIRGNRHFVNRVANLCYNRGIIGTGAEVQWCYLEGKSFAYIITPTLERLRSGIVDQFRSEITMSGEVPPLKDHMDDETGDYILELDEGKILKLATERANRFLADQVPYEAFLPKLESTPIEEYGVDVPTTNGSEGEE